MSCILKGLALAAVLAGAPAPAENKRLPYGEAAPGVAPCCRRSWPCTTSARSPCPTCCAQSPSRPPT